MARFRHPHIMQVLRVFDAESTAYMVMEYVEGPDAGGGGGRGRALSETRVREVLHALADGLSAVHASGLLYRDIKPGNVMVRPDGIPVLIDSGRRARRWGCTGGR